MNRRSGTGTLNIENMMQFAFDERRVNLDICANFVYFSICSNPSVTHSNIESTRCLVTLGRRDHENRLRFLHSANANNNVVTNYFARKLIYLIQSVWQQTFLVSLKIQHGLPPFKSISFHCVEYCSTR